MANKKQNPKFRDDSLQFANAFQPLTEKCLFVIDLLRLFDLGRRL